jgi:hypothetical protein
MHLDRRIHGWIAAVAIGVAAFALYLLTLAPTVGLVDSGEFIFAATLLDIPHPPGTPLYVLIGHLFSRLPWGNPAFRLNLMSAVFAALAAAGLFLLALRALIPPPVHAGRKRRAAASPSIDIPGVRIIAAAIAALTYAASGTLWSYATVAEVYTLNTALLSLAVFFLLGSSAAGPALLFFGLALAVHHVSALFFLPGAVYWLWTARPRSFSAKTLLFLLPGIATYLYLPIRALGHPILNWGNPSTLERLFWHVSGKQYRSNFISDIDSLLSRAWFFARLAADEFTLLGLAFVLLGLYLLWSKSHRIFVFIGLTVGCNLFYALIYEISEDNEAYVLPTFLLLAICLGWGLRHVLDTVWQSSRKAIAIAVAGGLCILPIFSLWSHYAENNHRHYLVARDYGLNVLENLEPGALLLTMDWQLYSPLLYLQKVEGHRKDVACVDVNLLRRSWYVAYLNRQYPALMGNAADEAEIYLQQLDLFEHDRPYNPNAIQQAFVNLINRLVDTVFDRNRPVYATVDLSEEPGAASAYFRIPVGPVFRLAKGKPSAPPPPGRFRIASFTDRRLHLDPVMLRVRRNYALMLVNRGIFLTLYGRQAEAHDWFRKGIALDPGVAGMIPGGSR